MSNFPSLSDFFRGLLKDPLKLLEETGAAIVALCSLAYGAYQSRLRRSDAGLLTYSRLETLREAYQLFGLEVVQGEVSEERRKRMPDYLTAVITDVRGRIASRFKPRAPVNPDKLVLLVNELEVRLPDSVHKNKIDNFVLFSIYVLLYLFDSEESQLPETKTIIEAIYQTNPELYRGFWKERD
jgi:hypothetical protein